MLKIHREILEKWGALVISILTAFGEQNMRKIGEKKTGKGNKIFRGMHKVKMPFWERNIRKTILHIFQYSFPSRPILERVTGYQSMSLLDLQNHEKEMKTEVEKEN